MNIKNVCMIFAFFFTIEFSFSDVVRFDSAESACTFALSHEESLIVGRQMANMKVRNAGLNIAEYLPSLDVSYTDSSLVFYDGPDSKNKNISFGLSWVMFDGGKRRLNYSMNKIQTMYGLLENEEQVQYSCIEIMDLYNSCIVAGNTVKVDERLYENAVEIKKTMDLQFELGMILETDLLDYEINLMDIKNRLQSDKTKYESMLRQLKLTLGLDLRTDIELTDTINSMFFADELTSKKESLYCRVMSKNIELKKMLLSMDYDERQTKLNKAFYYPSITIQPTVGFQGESFPLHDPKCQIQVALSFDHNPFIPLKLSSSVSFDRRNVTGVTDSMGGETGNIISSFTDAGISKLGLLKIQAEYRRKQKTLYSELHELCDNHDEYLNSLRSAHESLELQKKLMNVSRYQLENGNMKYTDYLKILVDLSSREIEIQRFMSMIMSIEEKLSILTGLSRESFRNDF